MENLNPQNDSAGIFTITASGKKRGHRFWLDDGMLQQVRQRHHGRASVADAECGGVQRELHGFVRNLRLHLEHPLLALRYEASEIGKVLDQLRELSIDERKVSPHLPKRRSGDREWLTALSVSRNGSKHCQA